MAQARNSRSFILGLAFTLVVAAALSIGALFSYWQIKSGYDEQAERRRQVADKQGAEVREGYAEQLSRRLKTYAASAAAGISTQGLDGIQSEHDQLAQLYRKRLAALQQESGVRRAALIRRDGTLVVDTDGRKFGLPAQFGQDANELEACFTQGPVTTIEYTDERGRVYRNAFAPVRDLDTGAPSNFAVAIELEADYVERLNTIRERGRLDREAQIRDNQDRLVTLRVVLGTMVGAVFIVTLAAALLIARYEARLLADLARQRRLAELAQFSAGMAHQIKNPLAAMRGYAELISRQLEDPLQKKMSDKLVAEISALDRVVRDFLAFSRGAHGSPEKLTLRSALAPVVDAAKARGGDPVQVELHCDEGPELEVDATSLRQALMNLGVNAAEALRENAGGGRLDIRAAFNGKMVTVEFEDNGPGIPEEVRGRLFEPFVTGKADGTGLGLAISRRLLRDLGGELLLVRTGPSGTMFKATFAKKTE